MKLSFSKLHIQTEDCILQYDIPSIFIAVFRVGLCLLRGCIIETLVGFRHGSLCVCCSSLSAPLADLTNGADEAAINLRGM